MSEAKPTLYRLHADAYMRAVGVAETYGVQLVADIGFRRGYVTLAGRAQLTIEICSDHVGRASMTWRLCGRPFTSWQSDIESQSGTADDLSRAISDFVLIERGDAA